MTTSRTFLRTMQETAVRLVDEASLEEVQADERTVLALERAMEEIMGEAARRPPPEFRGRYHDIPWPEMIGTRQRLAHGCCYRAGHPAGSPGFTYRRFWPGCANWPWKPAPIVRLTFPALIGGAPLLEPSGRADRLPTRVLLGQHAALSASKGRLYQLRFPARLGRSPPRGR